MPISSLHTLLRAYADLDTRHRYRTAPYLDADGQVQEDEEDAYEEALGEIKDQAVEFLRATMASLAKLSVPPEGEPLTVHGTWRRRFSLTAGVIDDAALTAFSEGQCHALALAVAERTGWPLAAILSDECCLDLDCCTLESVDQGVCPCRLEHVVAVAPDGSHVDITGAHAPGTVPDYEGKESVAMTDALWDCIRRSPGWRPEDLHAARAFVQPLLDSLGRLRGHYTLTA